MSVLTGPEIIDRIERTRRAQAARGGDPPLFVPRLDIEPFDPRLAGPNSYDVHLGDKLLVYDLRGWGHLDTRQQPDAAPLFIHPEGIVLQPGTLYLGSTVERVSCHGLVPWIDGRSSVGRLGISVHVTAGRGDDGFEGCFTLEITVVHPVRVYAGDRIAQLTFLTTVGERNPYHGRYAGADGPEASKFHLPTKE